MHLYWRIQQDLEESGHHLVLHQPSLAREYKLWVKKNSGALALAMDWCHEDIERLLWNQN
jgi:hypothetical protein